MSKDGLIRIRPARLADQAELIELIRAYYRFDHIRFLASAPQSLEKLLRQRTLGKVWIARDAARAIGYCVLTYNYDLEFGGLAGLVTDLFIRAEYRGQGLGRKLIDRVADYCRERGISAIELQVEHHNKDAQAFYRQLGFRQLSRMVMSLDISR